MMKKLWKSFVFLSLLMLFSCHSEPSLQKYLVKHQDSEEFIYMDLSGNMLFGNLKDISKENRENLAAFRKINVLTLPMNGENVEEFEKELSEVQYILKSGDYNLLGMFKKKDANFQLYYMGNPESIKEIVVFTSSKEKGFAIVRILAKDLNPEKFYAAVKSLKDGTVNLNLESIEDILEGI